MLPQHVEGGLGVDPVAARLFPVGLAHVLHENGLAPRTCSRPEQGTEHFHRVAEETRFCLSGVVDLRLGAGIVGEQHAVELAGRGAIDLHGRERVASVALLQADSRQAAAMALSAKVCMSERMDRFESF